MDDSLCGKLPGMGYPATTEAQNKMVIVWIAYGVEGYGERVDPDPKIRRYGEEFGRILGGDVGDNEIDLPPLRKDLLKLIDKQCPAADIVELMVRCTSETNVALSSGVQRCDIAEEDLSHLERCIQQAADGISQLRRSSVPGSLSPGSLLFIPNVFAGAVEAVEQARHHLKNLAECSDSIAERLSHCRPADNFPYSSWVNAFLKDGDLCFFYTFLKVFHCGYPTLSRLLKAMRRVRYTVDGDTESLCALSRKRIMASASAPGCKSLECKIQDPFSQLALQRRMNRFFRLDLSMTDGLKKCVQLYYSDECISRKQGRETLMEFCDKIWERLVRGRKRQKAANSQSTMNSTTAPRTTLFALEATAGVPPTSSRRPRTPNRAPRYRVQ
jgi:hypothetical protein